MKFLKANGNYYGEFITSKFSTGAATDADSTPTATATKNGTDDGTFTLTVTKIDTGRYKVTGTVPAGYSAGDNVQISVAATVDSVAGKGVVDEFIVVTARPGIEAILADLKSILGTALTETSTGYLAASFKKLHDVVTPVLSNDSTGMNVIADAMLCRDWTAITASPPARCAWQALRHLRNAWAFVANILSIYEEDDETLAWSTTVTTSGSAEPVTSSTPNS